MRRQKDILRAAGYYYNDKMCALERIAFVKGAEWADKTMIERSCEVLDYMTEGRLGEQFMTEFKKALEK